MANVSSSNGLEKRPRLSFQQADGSYFPNWTSASLGSIILPYSEKVYGEHSYEVLTSSREGLQRQSDHFATEQRHDTDGYNVIPFGYCTYRNRSDDGKFTFNMNKISENGIVSKFYPVFSFENANSEFMIEYLNSSENIKKKLSVLAVGTSQVVLSFEALKKAQFPIPCKAEQDRIAALLECINRRIVAQSKIVDSLKKYKRGLVNDIFSQRIVPYGERDEWTILPFREVVTINPKTGPLPDEFIYLDLECVNSGKVCAVNIIKRENAPSRAQRLLEKNDVLYQMVRPYQQNNYYYDNTFSSPVVASTGYAQIKCGACDPLFVYEQISSERFAKEAMLRSTGTSYPAINADDLGEIPFFLPSMHIQKKIGAILSLVNQKIFKSEEELQLLKSTKSSLLQQLFI